MDLFCAGPLRHPWQDRKAGAEKTGPVRYRRYGCRPPHTKQVHPIEHLAPASPTVQALGKWAGADLTGREMALQGLSVQALSRWVGADLTGGELAPTGPSVQGLVWRAVVHNMF
ncbi:hypothetical protein GCM10010483_67790 [Actinokineospora diospyrosa]